MPAADTFVVDASVVVELLLPGAATLMARDFLLLKTPPQRTFLAPRTAISEVAAAVTRGVRRGVLAPSEARTAYADWLRMIEDRLIELISDDDLLDPAFDLSLRLHHPLHDCIYVALARENRAGLATCDGVLARKVRAMGLDVVLVAP
jgi:predicted nucleic acid-binding protein